MQTAKSFYEPDAVTSKVAVFGEKIHELKAAPQTMCCNLSWKTLDFTMFEGGIQTENKARYLCGCYGNTSVVLLPVHKIIGVKVHSRRSCCCYTNTMVQFNVTTDAHEQQGGRGLFGSLFGGNPSVGTLNIEVPGSADTAPLFDYVYGVLGRSGHGAQMHSLAHMIGSGLVHKATTSFDLESQGMNRA